MIVDDYMLWNPSLLWSETHFTTFLWLKLLLSGFISEECQCPFLLEGWSQFYEMYEA